MKKIVYFAILGLALGVLPQQVRAQGSLEEASKAVAAFVRDWAQNFESKKIWTNEDVEALKAKDQATGQAVPISVVGRKKEGEKELTVYLYMTAGPGQRGGGLSLNPDIVIQPFTIDVTQGTKLTLVLQNTRYSDVDWAEVAVDGYPRSRLLASRFGFDQATFTADRVGQFSIRDLSRGHWGQIPGYLFVREPKKEAGN